MRCGKWEVGCEKLNIRIKSLGFPERYQEAAQYKGLYLGRVIAQYKDLYKVAAESSELIAEISGRLRYSNDELSICGTGAEILMEILSCGLVF